jgi:hypothetical protein
MIVCLLLMIFGKCTPCDNRIQPLFLDTKHAKDMDVVGTTVQDMTLLTSPNHPIGGDGQPERIGITTGDCSTLFRYSADLVTGEGTVLVHPG